MDRGLLDDLKDLLQERISFSESVRNNHAKGEDANDPILPKAVIFQKIMKNFQKFKIYNQLKYQLQLMNGNFIRGLRS